MDYKTYDNKRNLTNKIRKGDIVIHKNLDGQKFIAEYFELVIPAGLSIDRYPEETPNMKIKNVIFSDPATIVFWTDGSKTVVKSHLDDYDPEKGLAMAIAKKAFGNEGNYYNVFKKWLPKEDSSKETRDRILNEISEKCVNEIIERKLEAFRSRFENDRL